MKTITWEMTDEHFEVFAECFNRDMPIPKIQQEIDNIKQTDDEGSPIMVNQYTDLEWVELYLAGQGRRKALKGRNKLVLDGNPPDQELIETILANL